MVLPKKLYCLRKAGSQLSCRLATMSFKKLISNLLISFVPSLHSFILSFFPSSIRDQRSEISDQQRHQQAPGLPLFVRLMDTLKSWVGLSAEPPPPKTWSQELSDQLQMSWSMRFILFVVFIVLGVLCCFVVC